MRRGSIRVVAAFVTCVAPAHAAEYFVATNGNDSASGATGAPFRTIRRAITAAMPGDTVRIQSGTYSGWSNQLNPTRSGRFDAWITFRADDGALPIIEPTSDITSGGMGGTDRDDDVASDPAGCGCRVWAGASPHGRMLGVVLLSGLLVAFLRRKRGAARRG